MKYIVRSLTIVVILLFSCNNESKDTIEVVDFDALYGKIDLSVDKTYVINFWATWCAPCVKELPHFEEVNKDPQAEILVNLPDQFVEIKSTGNRSKFEINEYKKGNLLNGFDDIDYLINIKSEIINFSKSTPL